MSKNEQPPACRNAACGDQRQTIKHCLQDCLHGGTTEGNTGWRKDTTVKELWSGENDEIS